LKAEWLKREKSASELAREFGVTRNSILGKIFRAGLSGFRRPNEHPAEQRHKAQRASTPKYKPRVETATVPLFDMTAPESKKLTIYQLTDKVCHWPEGEGPPFFYCGNPITRERSRYCDHHYEVAYHTVTQRRLSVEFLAAQ
jgi:hypothetical protein